jgi:hypothetical protein
MISIIVCSINPELREKLRANIQENIGCEWEFLFEDNSLKGEGICMVYNRLAAKARGSYLCFVHEDVLIETKNWGCKLMDRASDESVGVIGFAGSARVDGRPYWHNKPQLLAYYFKQYTKEGSLHLDFTQNETLDNGVMMKVCVLDGMFLFCRKKVWEENAFDEINFPGFHLYDIDFTLSAAQKYMNFVNREVVLNHYSLGSLSKQYYEYLMVFYRKWHKILPYPDGQEESLEQEDLYRLVIEMGRSGIKYLLSYVYVYVCMRNVNLAKNMRDLGLFLYCFARLKCKSVFSEIHQVIARMQKIRSIL